MSAHSGLNRCEPVALNYFVVCCWIGSGFEKFFPKSEESTGVNKSAEGEGQAAFRHPLFSFPLHCMTDFVVDSVTI